MGFVLFFVLLEVVSSARVYVSNLAGFRLQHVATLEWHSSCASVQAMVLLNKTFQPVDGFGGSFLRSGALALSVLEEHEQEKVLKALFHPEEGAGLSVGKVPIGACDYCVLSFEQNTTWWGYRENRSLPFSLGPDLELPGGTIPYIRRARQHMKDALLLQATMDYPPEWMLLGALPNATVNPAFYGELARYYLDYSKEFSKHAGFALRYLSLFNEPKDSYTYISTEEIADLLVNHVGPLFRSQSSVKLTYASQADRVTTFDRTPKALRIPGVLNFTDVLFYHGYDCAPWVCTNGNNTCPQLDETEALIQKLHSLYPDIPLWMTEVCYAEEYGNYGPPCPNLPFSAFEDSLQWAKMILADLAVGARAWIYWNMILNENGGPHLTSPLHNDPAFDVQQPLVIVNSENLSVSYTGAFFAISHFGRFVKRGMRRLESSFSGSVNVYSMAFRNDREYVIQLVNDSKSINRIKIVQNERCLEIALTPVSITTIVF